MDVILGNRIVFLFVTPSDTCFTKTEPSSKTALANLFPAVAFVAKRPVFQQITEERKDVLKKSLLRTLFYQKGKTCETKEELGSDSTEMEV